MKNRIRKTLSKTPEITLVFWIIKIAATTLGETGGDAVTMNMNLGYLVGTAIFATILAIAAYSQIATMRFHPLLYWSVIVATTTTGTTLADFADRSLGIGYVGGSLLLMTLLLASLALWYKSCGSVSVNSITSPKAESFYWITILFSQTLGTALGDWVADFSAIGYEGGALIFLGALAVILMAYYLTSISRILLFWSAFILTRPLGATLGDLLDKPLANGGLAMDRLSISAILAAFMIACILFIPQRASREPGSNVS
jgi:uncharacterized membrane-anchored protein